MRRPNRMAMRVRALAVPLLLVALPCASAADKKPAEPPPDLTYSAPAAIPAGVATKVTFFGAPAGEPTGFWSSFPLKATCVTGAGKPQYTIEVPAGTPVGIGGVRLTTARGLSNLQLFMVDDLPTEARSGKNTTRQTAQTIKPMTAIEGNCEPLTSDYYRFAAKKGQRIAIEVVAQRLGSRTDPMVRLLSESGAELAYVDDTPGLGADCRFAHTFAADGNYVIELRDANYEGGGDYRYRLRVGDFPAVTAAFPVGAKRGGQTQIEIVGAAEDRVGPIAVTMPTDGPRAWVGARLPGGHSSAMVSVVCGDNADLIAGANLSAESAMPVTAPGAVSGRFEHAGDVHWFTIAGGKGKRLAVRSEARAVGSPCDISLRLLKPDGTRVGESKSTGPDEGSLDASISDDVPYRLLVEDLNHLGGVGAVYRLTFAPRTADFSFETESDKFDVAAGGTIKLKVKVTRRDLPAAIRLALTGDAAAHLRLLTPEIPAGKTDADIDINIPPDAPTGGPLAFGIVGTAKSGDAEITHPLGTDPALKKLWPRLFYPPPELDGSIGLLIRPKKAATSTAPTTAKSH